MHKDIVIEGVPAYHSYPDGVGKHPGLIIIHEIWGLSDHIKDVADRFAREGYSVIAPNLFHGMSFEGKVDNSLLNQMHDPATRDEAQKKMREIMAPMQAPEFAGEMLAKLEQCVKFLMEDAHVTTEVIGVAGFCFGGTYSLALAALDQRIRGAVSFYGQPLPEEKIPDLDCPVLAFYGDQDERLMGSLPVFKESMAKHNKNFTSVVYPNTGHAFFNDTNKRMYNSDAASDAWEKTLAFLSEHLKNN